MAMDMPSISLYTSTLREPLNGTLSLNVHCMYTGFGEVP